LAIYLHFSNCLLKISVFVLCHGSSDYDERHVTVFRPIIQRSTSYGTTCDVVHVHDETQIVTGWQVKS